MRRWAVTCLLRGHRWMPSSFRWERGMRRERKFCARCGAVDITWHAE